MNKPISVNIISSMNLSLLESPVSAGFPSPAEDYIDLTLDPGTYLVENPAATYLLKVSGESMVDAGIMNGDIIIVDKSLTPRSGDIIVAELGGEFLVKYFIRREGRLFLVAANEAYPDIEIKSECICFGVVRSVMRKIR